MEMGEFSGPQQETQFASRESKIWQQSTSGHNQALAGNANNNEANKKTGVIIFLMRRAIFSP
jgi:hypothetical protein